MYQHDAINATSISSFQWCVKSKPVATYGFPAPPHTVLTPLIPLLLNEARGPSNFYKFFRFKKKNQQQKPAQNIHIIWNCIPLISSWRQLSKKFFLNTSNPSFCYWKKLSVVWLSSVWINCLDYSSKIILMKAVTVLCFFSIDSILQILTKWTTLPISDGKLAWIPQTYKKPKPNTKYWATDLWAPGSSFVIPFRMPHELENKEKYG